MTYEYVCYTCGMPSAEPTCESCATHYATLNEEREEYLHGLDHGLHEEPEPEPEPESNSAR